MRRLVGSLLAVIAASASACSGGANDYEQQTFPVTPGHRQPVTIGRGALGASEWTLVASQSGDGFLCMNVEWQPTSEIPSPNGCGFGSNTVDDGGRGTTPVDVAVSAQQRGLAYGPSPRGAVRVTLTMPTVDGECRASAMKPTTTAITHRVPSWYPNPGTGWFTVEVPVVAASCVVDARFVDADGDEVEQPNNF